MSRRRVIPRLKVGFRRRIGSYPNGGASRWESSGALRKARWVTAVYSSTWRHLNCQLRSSCCPVMRFHGDHLRHRNLHVGAGLERKEHAHVSLVCD